MMKSKSMKDLDKLHDTNPILNTNISVDIPEPALSKKIFLTKKLSSQTNPTALKKSISLLRLKKLNENSENSDIIHGSKTYDNISQLKNVIINDISQDSDSNLTHPFSKYKKNKLNGKFLYNKSNNYTGINNTDININATPTHSTRTNSSGGTSHKQASETPWTAIDTLDDVKMLANQQSYETHFQKNFEEQLARSRRNDIKLLQEMRSRNARLMKHDVNVNNNSLFEDKSSTLNRSNSSGTESDNDGYWSFNESTVSPSSSRRGNRSNKLKKEDNFQRRAKATDEQGKLTNNKHRGSPINSRHRASFEINVFDNRHIDDDDEPLYVSDYVDSLRNIHRITERERQYVERLEDIVRDRMNLVNHQNPF